MEKSEPVNVLNYEITDEMTSLVAMTTLEKKFHVKSYTPLSLSTYIKLLNTFIQNDETLSASEKFEQAMHIFVMLNHTSILYFSEEAFDVIAFFRKIDNLTKQLTGDESRIILQAVLQLDEITLSAIIDGGQCPKHLEAVKVGLLNTGFMLTHILHFIGIPLAKGYMIKNMHVNFQSISMNKILTAFETYYQNHHNPEVFEYDFIIKNNTTPSSPQLRVIK